MGSSHPVLGRIGSWWRPYLTGALDRRVAGHVVWDLLPGVHAAAWDDQQQTYRARWQVRVLREGPDGDRSTVSHDNKATKGYLVRHLLESAPRSPAELLDIELPGGYRVDAAHADWSKRGGRVEIVQQWQG